jgi:hypothetical protein
MVSSSRKISTKHKEQIDMPSFQSDRVDGEFVGKVVKSGRIVFETKSDLDKITSFNYVVTGAINK